MLWEQLTGRPVSVAVQNVAALVGLALIGAVFLMTTYNDLANLRSAYRFRNSPDFRNFGGGFRLARTVP